MALHTFQPFSLDEIEINPFVKIGKDWGLVSAGNKENYNTMTVSWGGMGIMWGKKVCFIFVRESRHTKTLLDQGELFSVSFVDESYRDALNYCGSHSGKDEDKFEKAGLTPAFKLNTPYVDEANFVLICHKMATIPINRETIDDNTLIPRWYGDKAPDHKDNFHTMYIGEIMESMAR